MRPITGFGLALLAATVVTGPALAQNYQGTSCNELWRQRTAIQKRLGYCFTDPRAVAAFGNDGCTERNADALAYTPQDRDRIAQITLAERMKLCR